MSLINDALRRAKQAQQEAPAPPIAPVPQLRPVEPSSQAARHSLGLMLPLSLAAIALLSLLLYWELSKRDGSLLSAQPSSALPVAARGLPSSSASPDNLVSGTTAADSAAAANTPALAAQPNSSSNGSNSLAVAAGSETNHSAATESAVPAPLKLQGIIYSPQRPSAIISGRVVFVGERLHEYRVIAIHKDSVLLIGAGQTNLLSLEP